MRRKVSEFAVLAALVLMWGGCDTAEPEAVPENYIARIELEVHVVEGLGTGRGQLGVRPLQRGQPHVLGAGARAERVNRQIQPPALKIKAHVLQHPAGGHIFGMNNPDNLLQRQVSYR